MKMWIKAPINLTITSLLSAFSYVALVSGLNKGIGLGEPIWEGFILQVIFHFIFTFVALLLLITPLYFVLGKVLGIKAKSLIICNMSIFAVIFLLYVFIVSVDGFWLGVFVPCLVGIFSFSFIEHLTSRPKPTPQSGAVGL